MMQIRYHSSKYVRADLKRRDIQTKSMTDVTNKVPANAVLAYYAAGGRYSAAYRRRRYVTVRRGMVL